MKLNATTKNLYNYKSIYKKYMVKVDQLLSSKGYENTTFLLQIS